MDYLDEARERFKDDLFATEAAEIKIEAADVNYAKCSMVIKPIHKNAANAVMGGAIFTLADFTFAVAANTGNPLTVTQTSNIMFIGAAKGDTLFAEAKCTKTGKRACYFTIDVYDNLENRVATVSTCGCRL